MVLLDLLLGGLLVFAFIKGIFKSLIVEIASLLSIILGIYIALKFSFVVSGFLQEQTHSTGTTLEIIAFLITFALVVVVVQLLAKVFSSLADMAFLGWINKGLGGVFGALKMMLIISVFLNIFEKANRTIEFISPENLEKSIFYKPIQAVSKTMYPTLENWYNQGKEKFKTKPTAE